MEAVTNVPVHPLQRHSQPAEHRSAAAALALDLTAGEVISYSLQDPIKNIICSPE